MLIVALVRVGWQRWNLIIGKQEKVFIAGPVTYFPDTTLLGKFQTMDFMTLVGIAAASIRNGFYTL